MKAAITPEYGTPEIIQIREVANPTVGAGEILVEVHASPVTAGDRRLRAADFPTVTVIPGRLMMGVFRPRNAVQGTMFAGRIIAVGEGVTRFVVGEDVFGSVDAGAYAQQVVVKADGPVAKMPDSASYTEAADVPYGAVTALRFLRDFSNLQSGEHVLILGASGGVGRYAIQLAKHFGAEVTAVASGASEALVRELGADHFIDYRATDWRDQETKYDVIFDIADATSFGEARSHLVETGRYATVYMTPGVLMAMLTSSVFGGPQAKCGVALGTQEDMELLGGLLADGVLQSTVGATFPLDDVVGAHAAAESNEVAGTVMVEPRPQLRLRAVA